MTTPNDTPDYNALIAARLRELDTLFAEFSARLNALEKAVGPSKPTPKNRPRKTPQPAAPQARFSPQPMPATA